MLKKSDRKNKNILYIILSAVLLGAMAVMWHFYNDSGKYKVLIIYSFDETYGWGNELNEGIKDAFKDNYISADIHTYYLSTDLLYNQQKTDSLSLLLNKYENDPFDLIITCDDQATASLFQTQSPLISTVPIVFCGVDVMDKSLIEGYSNVTGFTDIPDFAKCYQLARRLFGRITDIIIIGEDDTHLGRSILDEAKGQLSKLGNLTKIYESFPDYYAIDTLNAQQAVVNPFELHIERIDHLTGSGLKRALYYRLNSFCILPKWDQYYSFMAKMGTAPFLMINSEGFGDGRLGGYMTPSYNQAYDAATVGSKILKGASVSDFPITQSKQYPVFDWEQLQYWNIDLSLLPEDSIIPNMPILIKYRTQLVASLIIASLFILLFVSLLIRLYKRESFNKKQVQLNLIKEQKELDITMDSLGEGVVSINSSGLVLSINKAAVDWLRLDSDKTYTGFSIWSLFDIVEKDNPNYLRELVADFFLAIDKNQRLSDTAYVITANKREFPVSGNISSLAFDSKMHGAVITFRDITDEYTQKQFLALSMSSGDIFPWQYYPSKQLIYFEPTFFQTLNIPDDGTHSIAVITFINAIHPQDFPVWRSTMNSVLSGELEVGSLQFRLNLNGSGYIWWEYRVSQAPINKDDEQVSFIGVCMNVEKFKQTEEELTRLKEEAERSDEMKGIFMANMSHEVRTPLNAIVGFSSILIDNNDLPAEDRKEFIDIINSNCRLLLNLINEILDISRIESGIHFREEVCDLNAIVQKVIAANETSRPADVDVVMSVPELSVYHVSDSFRLVQIYSNLLGNAYKFTSKGVVEIGYEKDDVSEELKFWVKDTGVGISEEDRIRIFDRFYKSDDFVQGGGLGLSIVEEIVKRWNGRMELESELGKGSTFIIYLPWKKVIDLSNKKEEAIRV